MMTENKSPQPKPGSAPHRPYLGKRFENADGTGQKYRLVNRLAIPSLVFGILSLTTMFGWIMVVFPVVGIVLGIIALRQIRTSTGEMTGRKFAISGIICSIALTVVGLGFLVLVAYTEVPIGYTEVTFKDLQPDKEEGEVIPKKILDLDGKNIYLRGFMYPGRRQTSIQEFIFVPSRSHCKFCARQLKSTEMVKVRTVGDLLVDFSIHQMGVGGKLKIDRIEASKPLGGMPYIIEADYSFQR
jgi:hypothetical protein